MANGIVPSEHANTRGGRKSTDFTLLTQDVTVLLCPASSLRVEWGPGLMSESKRPPDTKQVLERWEDSLWGRGD